MRAIERFLDSGRFEYNIGEQCYLSTSLTWFLSWAGLTALFHNLDIARWILSLLSHAFAFWTLSLLAKRFIRQRLVLMIVLLVVFADPFYLRWFWGGWETSWKIGFAALALYSFMRLHPGSRSWEYFAAGLCSSLAILTRPEMVVIAGLGILACALKYSFRWSPVLLYAAGAVVLWIPWSLSIYRTYGWFVSHTIYADTMSFSANYFLNQGIKFIQLVIIPQSALLLLLLAAVIAARKLPGGTAPASEPRGAFHAVRAFVGERRAETADILALGVWAFTMFGYVITGSYIASIYTLLFTPFLSILIGSMIDMFLASRARSSWLDARRAVVFLAAALAVSIGIDARIYYRYSIFNPRYRSGEDSRFIEFARRVADFTKPADVLGLWELGVIGYYSNCYIVDFAGLATPEIIRYKLSGGPDYVSRYLRERGVSPDFIVNQYEERQGSAVNADPREFFGIRYRPVYRAEVQRIRGHRRHGFVDLYVLYQRE